MAERTHFRTGDQALVREINLSLVMNRLREHAPTSRAALAEMTGLNKSTISSLVHELIAHQFVRELGLSTTNVGRPSTLLELNPAAGCIVSAEIGVDFISVITTNFSAEIIWRHREPTQGEHSQDVILQNTVRLLQEAAEAGCAQKFNLLGLAVGIPGLVDERSGTVLFAPNLHWENVSIRDVLRSAFPKTPLYVENEANMAAMGEHYFGAAQGFHEVLYISAGVGLGGAVVIDSQLFRGASGFASEFGHMTMYPDGDLCNCGNRGCWETQVSQSAVFRHIQRAAESGQRTLVSEMLEGDFARLTIPIVVDAAGANDKVTIEALEHVGRDLGVGIASLVNVLNPDVAILGGSLSLAGDFLLPIVQAELTRRTLRWNASTTKVLLAQHGVDACVMGGVALVYQAILAQPSRGAR